jgi:hypothetical protein
MAVETKTYSAASCSWIDAATGLPEVDAGSITGDSVSRSFLTGNLGFRFCNFTEVWVTGDFSTGSVVGQGFTNASGIYRGPSFAHIPSHAFTSMRDIFLEADAVRFTHVTGARTVSPEVLGTGGGIVGGAVAGGIIGSVVPGIGTVIGAGVGAVVFGIAGEVVGHRVIGFPPIWSKIQIRIYRNGRVEAQLLQHSLFPSLTFYQQIQRTGTPSTDYERVDDPEGGRYYNATKSVQLPKWQANGWGALKTMPTPGACAGNPWGISHGITGGGEIAPN